MFIPTNFNNEFLFILRFAFSFELLSRLNISSDGKYERIVGYSRAVRCGNMVFVSGTTGVSEDGALTSGNESYEQTRRAIGKIEEALRRAGCTLNDIVLTRVFLSNQAEWKEVAKAHSEFFGEILPASSMLVCEFLDPKTMVEIEAQAIV